LVLGRTGAKCAVGGQRELGGWECRQQLPWIWKKKEIFDFFLKNGVALKKIQFVFGILKQVNANNSPLVTMVIFFVWMLLIINL